MKIPSMVILVLLIILSFTAGIAKVMQLPAEMEFLQGVGFSSNLVILFGLMQIMGGALLVFQKTRTVGAILVVATLSISSITIFMAGKISFGLFSILPVAMAGILLMQSATQRRIGVGLEEKSQDEKS